MKKLFFFRSSSSNNGNHSSGSHPSTDKQVYWEMPLENELNSHVSKSRSPKGLVSKFWKQVNDNLSSCASSFLRRSCSVSSAAFLADGQRQNNFSCIDDQNRSPTDSISSASQCDYPSR